MDNVLTYIHYKISSCVYVFYVYKCIFLQIQLYIYIYIHMCGCGFVCVCARVFLHSLATKPLRRRAPGQKAQEVGLGRVPPAGPKRQLPGVHLPMRPLGNREKHLCFSGGELGSLQKVGENKQNVLKKLGAGG